MQFYEQKSTMLNKMAPRPMVVAGRNKLVDFLSLAERSFRFFMKIEDCSGIVGDEILNWLPENYFG